MSLLKMGSYIRTSQGAGSTGFFVRNQAKTYLITAGHLFAEAVIEGEPVYAATGRIGYLERWVPFSRIVLADTAAVVMDNPDIDPAIPRIGSVTAIRRPILGETVWKYGAVSRLTHGTVDQTGIEAYYQRTNSIVHNVFSIKGMRTRPGDSGGPVFGADGYLVGIVSGGNGVALATDADTALQALGLNTASHLLSGSEPFALPGADQETQQRFWVPIMLGAALLVLGGRQHGAQHTDRQRADQSG